MIIKRGYVANFGSYEMFEFNFSIPGLHLISGPTGAGKSTICDLIPWVLFGRTAKNGAANDVLAWNAKGDTEGTVFLDVRGRTIEIYRRRGKNGDLYLSESDGLLRRGKDVTDTQRLINQVLGITADQYLVSAYYHEMSHTAQFFQTTAKNRRQITEQLVDLTQVIKASEGLVAKRKEFKEEIESQQALADKAEARLEQLDSITVRQIRLAADWDISQGHKIEELEDKINTFSTNKKAKHAELTDDAFQWNIETSAKMATLINRQLQQKAQLDKAQIDLELAIAKQQDLEHSELCKECGSRKNSNLLYKHASVVSDYQAQVTSFKRDIANTKNNIETVTGLKNPIYKYVQENQDSTNVYVEQLKSVINETNPHLRTLSEYKTGIEALRSELELKNDEISGFEQALSHINLAIETSDTVRQALIETTMREVEQETNRLLAAHFDAIMRIEFIAEEFDKLDVNITKDGNLCSYTQLSKGQKQLLKLCFAVSCIKTAANRSNVKFEQLFFDEAFEGLDDVLKIKSFSLLEELQSEYNSVYVVEHNSDLKTMFTSRFEVNNINGNSQIEKVI